MKFCPNCGTQLNEGHKFCPSCGHPVSEAAASQAAGAPEQNTQAKSAANDSLLDKIHQYVGGVGHADLNWRLLFTDVMKKHTIEEADDVFICGTHSTTPKLSEMITDWPRPWLYSRVFAVMLLTYVLLMVCAKSFENILVVPGLMTVGAFAIPLSALILFMEVNVYRNISFYNLLSILFVGGTASLVVTMVIFKVLKVGDFYQFDFGDAVTIGIIEEVAKAVIVFIFIKRLKTRYVLNGLLIGAAVGAGFAAFESTGYAFVEMLYGGFDSAIDNILLRGVLAPGGHVAWAAMTGAAMALVASKTNTDLNTNHLGNVDFLKILLIPIALHTLWDWNMDLSESLGTLWQALLLIAAWVVILFLINVGLKQASDLAASASAKDAAPVTDAPVVTPDDNDLVVD